MNSHLILLAVVSAVAAVGVQASANVIRNPGFERGLDGWVTQGSAEFALDRGVKHRGLQSLRIGVAKDGPVEGQQISWTVPAKPGSDYDAGFWLKCKGMKSGLGAYGAIEFMRGDERLGFVQSFPTQGSHWHRVEFSAKVPPTATHIRFCLIVNAHGTAWFDDVSLSPPLPQPERAVMELQPRKLISNRWQGFGTQGDMFLYRTWNTDQGLNEEDRKLILDRVRAMRPQVVRLLFMLGDWEPERGQPTPKSEGMEDLRRTIAFYKEIGTDVHLTEWGFTPPAWTRPMGLLPHPEETAAFTDSFVAAVKYLREDCGLDNIRYLTIYNEPNGNPIPFEDYVRVYRALDRSLKDAGMRKEISILGPDEANNYDWLPRSIAELDDVIDCYDAHNYTTDTGRHFGTWVAPRVADMPKLKSSDLRPRRKRLMITEFGMHDQMETFSTPHNGEYYYGIFLADSAISAASEGASAMLMWCLMDTNYFANYRMKWGLWRFKDENWEPRPGFYAWSLITRYTELGSSVYRVKCDVKDAVAVAFRAPTDGAWMVMCVNRRKSARPFTLKGLPPDSKWEPYVYSENAVPTADRRMIKPSPVVQCDEHGEISGEMPGNSFVLFKEGS